MEQALKMLSTSKSLFTPRRRSAAKNESSTQTNTGELKATPTALYPLSELLEQLLRQEAELWKKNEGLCSAIKVAGNPPDQAPSEPSSLRGNGLTPTPTPSLAISPSNTPTPTPPLTSSHPPDAQDTTDRKTDREFYLVQYGRLTDDIHQYFRRLEKRHACLYLTKRKAKHENLRHVETQAQSDQDEAHGPEVQSAGYLVHGGGGGDGQLVTLRDEELLVFRAALMCAQFPMLSAPSPPEGASPTPTPPLIPLSTIGSPDAGDLSRTAPSEMHEDQIVRRQSGAVPSRTAGGKASPRIRRSASERIKTRGKHLESVRSPDGAGADGAGDMFPEPGGGTKGNGTGLTSEAITIKGKSKPGLRRTSSTHSTSSTSSRKQAKRLAMDAASMLPAVDSDEDDELAELSRIRSLRSKDSAHLVGREHPFSPMVNREMLCSLVRTAFKQTEEQQLQFEQMLKHDYGRRSKGEILAKELAGQLQVLENNAHPFYKPKLFVTRNGYDQWLLAEKQRVRSLIDKFWHFSLPRPQLWRHYNPTDYHRAYSLLLTRIVCCESRTERKEPVHAGKTPSSPLSPTAQRLLNEFGLRYGVGELYRKIVYLDYLARHFDYEIWYIRHCTEELRAIRDLLPRNRNKITAVRKEMDLLKTTVHLLHGQTDNCLTKIDRLFHDSPTEGVASLIALLAEVLDAELSLFGKRVTTVEEWLKRYLKRGFALRYERRKEIHADETMHTRTAKPFVPTPALVNALLLSIKDEVKDYRDKFQPVFRPYFDIVPFARMEFYRLMCSDACSLCLRTIHKPETRVRLNLEMLGLLYRLNERDSEWENVIPPDMQQWRHSFVDLALIWMEVLGKQINKWILNSVSRDKWTLLTFAVGTSSETVDTGFPTVPTHTMGVRAGVSSSPFPSPGYTPMAHTPHSLVGSIGSSGAFIPYRKPTREEEGRRQQRNPLEIVGNRLGQTRSPADDAVKPVAEIPDLVMRGANRSTPLRPSPQDNIMRFWQAGRNDGISSRDDSLTVEPAHEVEVSVSVYGSHEPSPATTPTEAAAVHNTSGSTEHAPNNDSSTTARETLSHEMTTTVDESSPPPLPYPVVENEAVAVATVDTVEKCDEEVVESRHSQIEEKREGEGGTQSGAVSLSGIPGILVNGIVTVSGTGHEDDKESEKQYQTLIPAHLDNHHQHHKHQHLQHQQHKHHHLQHQQHKHQHLQNPQPEEKQHSSSHSEYHTPDPISDDELNELSHGELVTAEKRVAEGGSEHQVTKEGEENTDGAACQSQHFTSVAPPVRFNSLLDDCGKGSGVWHKPRPQKTGADANGPTLSANEPPTDPNAVSEVRESGPLENGSVASSTVSSFHDTSHDMSKDNSSLSLDRHGDVEESVVHMLDKGRGRGRGEADVRSRDDNDELLRWKVDNHRSEKDHSYLFPISNSPMDIVTMLTRLACFTSTLLNTLTPKLRHGAMPAPDEPRRAHDYAPDVAMAKKQASQQLKHMENTHAEFLKKLHKIMYNSLKLYADNLLCMDLCCWSATDAVKLLGSEMLHHLQRRRDMKEVWGCRHMVEVRHGLHPNGIPCQKKKTVKFESITRDMCLRINNIHLLITIFPALETHLHSTTRKEPHKPATVFGYISSDVGDHLTPLNNPRNSVGMSLQSQADKDVRGLLVASSDHSALARGSLSSWGHSSSRERGARTPQKPEAGFASRDSDQLLEYLHNVQKVQLQLLCSRMNKFFKPALSLLLELKLGECGIERRLHPLITFLTRHRSALLKYIYPECFRTLMNYLWNYIVQDLEEEAVKLRERKKPVTDKAQMLLQALSHLIVFVHDKEEGVPLQTLTQSCEYLLALLDVMTRSTDQLINIFNKLSTPQFAMSRLDLTRAPVPVDSTILHTLRSQLHTFKKCFSGKEFVEQFLKLGREAETLRLSSSEPNTPSPQVGTQHSPGLGVGRVYNSASPRILYTINYAKDVGQYLLSERILLPLPNLRQSSSECDSDEGGGEGRASSDRLHESSSIQSEQRARRVAGEGGAGGRTLASKSPQIPRSKPTRDYRINPQESDLTFQFVSDTFVYSPNSLYKFSDVEDFESRALYHSQILSASAHPNAAGGMEEITAFEKARLGMLLLVHDLLLQRARKEKRAKQFLQTPHAVTVAERRKQQYVDCNLIFKM